MSDRATIEQAFQRIREELEIRTEFPPEVVAAAEDAASQREWESESDRLDLRSLPFVTIDPPGSRDLDQALLIERRDGGYLIRYAIADVGAFVASGGLVEEEAWRRGLTFYSPDRRDTLYPEAISQEVASLLPDGDRPAITLTFDLDSRGELRSFSLARTRIRSLGQLTYTEAVEHIRGDGALFADRPFAESLLLLREVGELRIGLERERGGVSLPILEQHVQQEAARRLGYEVVYEEPNEAEEWNAQISLLAGHAAAERMLAGGVGLLRTQPPPSPDEIDRLRIAARALGFDWPREVPYPAFIRSVPPTHPRLPFLLWQARRLMRGADYVAFTGEPPEHSRHSALAFTYAHCTAPLRRLADRYTLDLLVKLGAGTAPTEAERARLVALPPVMAAAERKSSRLERRVVDVAEAWELRDRVGSTVSGVVLDVRAEWVEVQIAESPVRTRVPRPAGSPEPGLGTTVELRVAAVRPAEGAVDLEAVR